MASLEDELRDLKEKNNELVQKVQYWKMTAAQRENEKLNLMKEINELRLKLSRLRSNGSVQASNLDSALQSASEKALAHLVRASSEIARTMELAKAYIRDRQELDTASPRWGSIGSTPNSDRKHKVHRVPPLIGGQSIQPVVALTMLNTSHTRSVTRSPNQTRNVTQRAVPMHELQDVYIPLTRIDAGDQQAQNMETEAEANDEARDSSEELGLDDIEETELEESQRMSEDEDFESSRRLDAVTEDVEPEEEEVTPRRSSMDNPLEGPSWMLDGSSDNIQDSMSKSRTNLEPDSTTGLEEGSNSTPPITVNPQSESDAAPRASREFSPTLRRRKRTSSPAPPPTPRRLAQCSPPPPTPRRLSQYSPRPVQARRPSNSGRVLKVLVAKMRLDGEEEGGSPPKRSAPALAQYDAPSPNGATVAGVIVSETSDQLDSLAAGEPAPPSIAPRRPSLADRTLDRRDAVRAERVSNDRSASRDDSRPVSRAGSHDSRDSDSSGGDAGEGRTRRPRKVVTYKEKPLNRKLRR